MKGNSYTPVKDKQNNSVRTVVLAALLSLLVVLTSISPVFMPPASANALRITTPTAGFLTTQLGCSYSLVISGNHGTGSRTYAIASGTLPTGLTLDTSTGIISGTPSVIESKAITVSVTDSAATPATATTDTFNINVIADTKPRITKVDTTATGATISWCGVAKISDANVTDYEVQYSLDRGANWTTVVKDPSTTTSHVITGLTNNSYGQSLNYYRIRALAGAATTDWSEVVIGTLFNCSIDPSPGIADYDYTTRRFTNMFYFTVTGCDFTYSYPGISPDYGSDARNLTASSITYTYDPALTTDVRINTYTGSKINFNWTLYGSSSPQVLTPELGPITNRDDASFFQITNYDATFTWSIQSPDSGCLATRDSYIDQTGTVVVISHSDPAKSCSLRVRATKTGFGTGDITAFLLPSTGGKTIVFNRNFGTGTQVASISSQSAVILPANTFTRTGYEFAGWNTNSFGTGTNYLAADEYPMTASDILFAKWLPGPATITLQPKSRALANGLSRTNFFETTATCAVAGCQLSYQWFKDGLEIAGETNRRLSISNMGLDKVGKYKVRVRSTVSSNVADVFSDEVDLYLEQNETSNVHLDARLAGSTTGRWINLTSLNGDNMLSDDAGSFPPFNTSDGKKYFSFTNDQIYPTTGRTSPSTTFALELYFRPTLNSVGKLIGFQEWSGTRSTDTRGSASPPDKPKFDRQLYLNTEGKLVFEYLTSSGSSISLTSDTAINDGQWHHVYAQFLSGTGVLTLVVDGVKKTSSPSYLVLSSYSGRWEIGGGLLGTIASPVQSYFQGDIAVVRIYEPPNTTGFTDQQISLLRTSAESQVNWVSYQSNGGSFVSASQFTTGITVPQPTNPTRTNFTFGGWFANAGLTTEVTFPYTPPALADTTLYAKWNATVYTVTYDFDGATGGNPNPSDQFTAGGSALTLPTPTKPGYTFAGWFNNSGKTGSALASSYTPSQSLTLYAKWNVNTYTVTFDAKGGSAVADGSYETAGSIATAPTPPTRSGFNFAGWSATDGGSAITFPYAPGLTENITLFAIWTAVPANSGGGGNNGGGNNNGGGGGTPVTPVVVIPPKQTPSTPVTQLTGGNPIAVTAGKIVKVRDGVVTADSVQIIQNQIVRAADNNVAVEVKSVDTGNQVKPVAPNLVLQFEQAGNAAVIGNGYRPASTVIVWLLSTPTRLGEVTVKADGSFDASMLIPADFPLGEHTLQVNGVTANNEIVSTSIGVVVVPKPAPAPVTVEKRVLNLSFFPTQQGPERKQAIKIRNLISNLKAGDVITCQSFALSNKSADRNRANLIANRLCAPLKNSVATVEFVRTAPVDASTLPWAKRKPLRVQVFLKTTNK